MRNLIFIVFIIIGVVISGCAVKGDINTVFKSIPEVQQFLKEHPNAKIVINLWSAEEVNSSINEISANCGKRLPVLAMYKATATGDDINVTSWFDAENQQMLCTVIVGSIKPQVTGIPSGFQIPPQISILPITLPTSDAPGNDIEDIPRYPGFIRMASATEENDSTLMYYGKADVNLVSDFYSSEMPRKGWVLIFLLGSATQRGEGSILGFIKENVTVTVVVIKDTQQNITLVMISRSPMRGSADIFYPIIPEMSPALIYPVNPILPVTLPAFDCNASSIIYGYKFNDTNSNGIMDNRESGFNNSAISLSGSDICNGKPLEMSMMTNATGYYGFENITAGNYIITSDIEQGWIPTTPIIQQVTIPVSTSIRMDFGKREI